MSTPKICLNMIVKDESTIIERCLASLLPAIDGYVICDTGSSDDTPQRVRSFFERRGVPGMIHAIPFVDFATTRNAALDLCRRSDARFEYILLVDADMELVIGDSDFKMRLADPAYAIRQRNGLSYYNLRLIRRDISAGYVGPTHEYLAVDASHIRLEGVHFLDHACGSSRGEKVERDLRLLTRALEDTPTDARSMFYLAQTYKDAKRWAEAIVWYQRRIRAGGWPEEVWYSKYMLALCHQQLGDPDPFIRLCLEAYDDRPTRAEPLYALAHYCRTMGQHESCVMLCEVGERISYPTDDSLFIDDDVYRVGFQEEKSISGFYCASAERRRQGRDACLSLATRRDAPGSARGTARSNCAFYTASAEETFGQCVVRELAMHTEPGYAPTNPSIWLHDGHLFSIVRCVNYRIENGTYAIHDNTEVIRTRNSLVELGEDYSIRTVTPLVDCSGERKVASSPVTGFEDCRLFRWKGRWWASCTVRDRHDSFRCQIALLAWDDDGSITHARLMQDIIPERQEKNWVPLVRDDELYFVYSTDPTVVLRCTSDCGRVRMHKRSAPSRALDHLRGGSQAIAHGQGWLYLVHEVAQHPGQSRYYGHRFVELDQNFRVRAVTDPFYFVHRGVEFCAGLVHDAQRCQFVTSIGVNDGRAFLAFLDEKAVCDRLKPM